MTHSGAALDWEDGIAVIAEVAQAHDGSLGLAHAHIDAAAAAGADAVKFQTHIADAESRRDEPWRVRFSYEDDTRFDYWKRMEFDEEGWAGLRRHAHERDLAFLSSPFSIEAFELLDRIGVDAWKIASGEVSNPLLVERCAESKLPVLLSTGMSGWEEIDAAVALVRERSTASLAVMQCTSEYPTAAKDLGLNVIEQIGERYGCAAGLSDHSGTIFPALGAVALGARVVEVHIALSREMFGPDVVASVTPPELAELVRGARMLAEALAAPVDKDAMAQRLEPTRELFTKSIVARGELDAGTVLTPSELAVKKPGGGMEPSRLAQVVGRRLRVPVVADHVLQDDDLEPPDPDGAAV
ncbi:MAG: N-acetylneuraminate synthase family protein [Candidatus Limnocylindria bacterium]